jgi:hypothetical protein
MENNQVFVRHFRFPAIEKETLKSFLHSRDFDKNVATHTLIPTTEEGYYLIQIVTDDQNLFDITKKNLFAEEIDFKIFVKALNEKGNEYESFYPATEMSTFY